MINQVFRIIEHCVLQTCILYPVRGIPPIISGAPLLQRNLVFTKKQVYQNAMSSNSKNQVFQNDKPSLSIEKPSLSNY